MDPGRVLQQFERYKTQFPENDNGEALSSSGVADRFVKTNYWSDEHSRDTCSAPQAVGQDAAVNYRGDW